MTIVVYQCDVCKRKKDFPQNPAGLEQIQRCSITHGCRGKLFQVRLLPDFERGSTPAPVAGLDDWRQRKVLFNHIQTIARDEWIIEHNLGTFPSISVFVNIPTEANADNLEEIQPTDTVVVDDNNMILRFDRSWSGQAQLVARQSDPDLLRPFTRTVETVATELQQISTSGEVVIATRVSSVGDDSAISLAVSYTNTQGVIVDHTYADVNVALPGTSSPWNDVDRVVIRGRIYTIRTYNGIIPEMLDDTIGNGSTFRFTDITPSLSGSPPSSSARPILRDEVYLLFASTPYDTVDKITDQYIDVFDVSTTENTFAFLYDLGDFFATNTILRSTYPLIRKV